MYSLELLNSAVKDNDVDFGVPGEKTVCIMQTREEWGLSSKGVSTYFQVVSEILCFGIGDETQPWSYLTGTVCLLAVCPV